MAYGFICRFVFQVMLNQFSCYLLIGAKALLNIRRIADATPGVATNNAGRSCICVVLNGAKVDCILVRTVWIATGGALRIFIVMALQFFGCEWIETHRRYLLFQRR